MERPTSFNYIDRNGCVIAFSWNLYDGIIIKSKDASGKFLKLAIIEPKDVAEFVGKIRLVFECSMPSKSSNFSVI